ncbi:MAG: phosphatidylserine decarboxylase family protein [Gammaproteobacteria bacterium]|nr:phosphatidylserine decarboxylase family protein [Gammaproteobacteria bacterium]MXX17163.1 phosphatidylserine decarboxylase family protein [Gammaproteobacteria bacterium]MYH91342.1 phosphatidylserine decarboxylase family protein [Gammaproteobacteria bacterium]
MQTARYPIFAPEGRLHLVLVLCLGALATWQLGWWSAPVWLLVLFVIQFFRDPPRLVSEKPGDVVAPASGKVVFIGEEENPYLKGRPRMRKISIFMNVFSVHSNLIPVGGSIRDCSYHRGSFFNASLDKASASNERNAVWIHTDEGKDVVAVQIAGLIARRIFCYVRTGDEVKTGQRYGFIRFGSRVDLYLPESAALQVTLNQWVASGNDVIGNLGT